VQRLSEALAKALATDKARAAIRALGNDAGPYARRISRPRCVGTFPISNGIIDDRKLTFPE
jgi:hypothetical protein